jgi:lipopolysaccharide O-acetyltransferase
MKVGKGFFAISPVWIEAVVKYKHFTYSPRLTIGDRFSCSEGLHISCAYSIEIGDDCLFGGNVYVGDHGHGGYSGEIVTRPEIPPSSRPLVSRGNIIIGNRVWIGNNSVILETTKLGDGVIVAANSVVKGTFPANCIVAGVPAKLVRMYDPKKNRWEVCNV